MTYIARHLTGLQRQSLEQLLMNTGVDDPCVESFCIPEGCMLIFCRENPQSLYLAGVTSPSEWSDVKDKWRLLFRRGCEPRWTFYAVPTIQMVPYFEEGLF